MFPFDLSLTTEAELININFSTPAKEQIFATFKGNSLLTSFMKSLD